MKEALDYLIDLYDNDVRFLMTRDRILFRLMDFEQAHPGGLEALHNAMLWAEGNEPERLEFRAMEYWNHDVKSCDPFVEPRCMSYA